MIDRTRAKEHTSVAAVADNKRVLTRPCHSLTAVRASRWVAGRSHADEKRDRQRPIIEQGDEFVGIDVLQLVAAAHHIDVRKTKLWRIQSRPDVYRDAIRAVRMEVILVGVPVHKVGRVAHGVADMTVDASRSLIYDRDDWAEFPRENLV